MIYIYFFLETSAEFDVRNIWKNECKSHEYSVNFLHLLSKFREMLNGRDCKWVTKNLSMIISGNIVENFYFRISKLVKC